MSKDVMKLKYYIISFLILLTDAHSLEISDFKPEKIIKIKSANHALWDKWLNQYVSSEGFVNYTNGKKDLQKLIQYTEYLQSIDAVFLKGKDEQLSYYINLYNSMTVLGIYRLTQIKAVNSVPDFFKSGFYLVDKKITLDILENKMIRLQFKNAYVHFALNCASYSCPTLLNRAFKASSLQSDLRQLARRYLSDARFALIDENNKKLKLIELFKWYAVDFGNPKDFFLNVTGKKKDLSEYQIQYLGYNWNLNGK